MTTVYGIQQTEVTLKQNIDNWQALHMNKTDNGEMAAYNADRIRKHKIRLIDFWRKGGKG